MYICTLQFLCIHRMGSALLSRFDLVCKFTMITHILYVYMLLVFFICRSLFCWIDQMRYLQLFELDSSYVHMYLCMYIYTAYLCSNYLLCNFTGIRLLVVQTCNVTTFSPCWCKSFFQSVSDICHCQKEF